MKSLGWVLIHDDWCSYKKRHEEFVSTDAKAEDSILRPPAVKSQLIGKDPDTGKY